MSRAHGSPLAAVAGTVAPGFEPVREAFAEAVASQHPATGAALAATHDGRLVVDLWAGATNAAGMPWQEDTLCVLFSGTKGPGEVNRAGFPKTVLKVLDDGSFKVWPNINAQKAALEGADAEAKREGKLEEFDPNGV